MQYQYMYLFRDILKTGWTCATTFSIEEDTEYFFFQTSTWFIFNIFDQTSNFWLHLSQELYWWQPVHTVLGSHLIFCLCAASSGNPTPRLPNSHLYTYFLYTYLIYLLFNIFFEYKNSFKVCSQRAWISLLFPYNNVLIKR